MEEVRGFESHDRGLLVVRRTAAVTAQMTAVMAAWRDESAPVKSWETKAPEKALLVACSTITSRTLRPLLKKSSAMTMLEETTRSRSHQEMRPLSIMGRCQAADTAPRMRPASFQPYGSTSRGSA